MESNNIVDYTKLSGITINQNWNLTNNLLGVRTSIYSTYDTYNTYDTINTYDYSIKYPIEKIIKDIPTEDILKCMDIREIEKYVRNEKLKQINKNNEI